MSIALTSTRYLLTTDDLRSGWDEKSWIDSADDRRTPDTGASSFDELQAAAVSGGPGSDAEKVLDQIMTVLSFDARSAEQWLESFCLDTYVLPLVPCDGVARDLMLSWMKHQTKIRHDLYRAHPDTQLNMERSLMDRAKMIRTGLTRLSAARVGVGSNVDESIAAFGSDPRRDSSDSFSLTLGGSSLGPFTGPRPRR